MISYEDLCRTFEQCPDLTLLLYISWGISILWGGLIGSLITMLIQDRKSKQGSGG